MRKRSTWKSFLGADVVLDTDTVYLYVGRLREAGKDFLLLEDADIHDRNDSSSTNEKYLIEMRRSGIRPNRRSVAVRVGRVVSVSRLNDIIQY